MADIPNYDTWSSRPPFLKSRKCCWISK